MTGPRIDGDAPTGRDTLPDFGLVEEPVLVVSPLASSILVAVGSVHADDPTSPADADVTPASTSSSAASPGV